MSQMVPCISWVFEFGQAWSVANPRIFLPIADPISYILYGEDQFYQPTYFHNVI